jgi:hypothetical protein
VVDASHASERFLRSDRPVEISKLNDPTGFVSMPISPTKLFVAANREQAFENLGRIRPGGIVRHVNTFVVSRARKFVWASDESQARFIENHMSKAMEPTPFFPNLARYETPQTAA